MPLRGGYVRIAVLVLVMSLGMVAPPMFSASASDHAGQLVHPLFPHAHASDHADLGAAGHATDGSVAGPHIDDQPGLRGQPIESGLRAALSGMLLPLALAALFFDARRLRLGRTALPHQHWSAPPAPPPRPLAPVHLPG